VVSKEAKNMIPNSPLNLSFVITRPVLGSYHDDVIIIHNHDHNDVIITINNDDIIAITNSREGSGVADTTSRITAEK